MASWGGSSTGPRPQTCSEDACIGLNIPTANAANDRRSFMKTIQSIAVFTFVGLWILIAPGYAAEVDHALYAALLDRERLDGQLNRAATAFINNPRFNRLEGDTLWVSKIFDWFEEDFNQDVVGTFIRYAEPQLKAKLENNRDRIKIRHLEYDWSLNGT
jgi:hypothetical protein